MKRILASLLLLALASATHGQTVVGGNYAFTGNDTHAAVNGIHFVDGHTYTTIQACIDSFSANPGVCLVPSSYAGAAETSIPDNVETWDLRQLGRLAIRGVPKTSPAVSAGLWVGLGPLTDTFTGPAVNNLVGMYSEVHCPGAKILCWGSNPLVNLEPGVPDANVWGLEVDTNIFGTGRSQQYAGVDVVTGGSVNPTFAFRAYNAAAPGIASWDYDFRTNGAALNIFNIDSPNKGLAVTQRIKASSSPQSVRTNGSIGTQLFIGMTISIDTGSRQENVLITNITGSYIITGVFLKNHSTNTGFAQYSANRFWEANNAVSVEYPYHLGSIQSFNNYNSANLALGFSVSDSNGIERLADFYTSTNVHTWRDVGTKGFMWQNQAGAMIAMMSDDGNMRWNGLQTARISGCATGASIGNACDVTVMWPTAFSDTMYTVQCMGDSVTRGVPIIEGINVSAAKSASGITVRTVTLTAEVAQFATIECTAIHD